MTKALSDFISNEWYYFFPLLFMSMTATGLIIWRVLLNMGAKTNMETFLPALQGVMVKDGLDGARKFCAMQRGLIPRKLFVSGIDQAKQGAAAMRRSMANVIEQEILPDLNFLLAPIIAIAKIATMVGLLLTVVSMIGVFGKIREAVESGDAAGAGKQSGAIGLALFATAMGLITAIPLVFSHVLFKDGIHKFELKMKSNGQKLITLVQNLKEGKLVAPPPPPGKGPPPPAADAKQPPEAVVAKRP